MPKNPSSERIVFAVDLGGTHLRVALVDDTGRILKQHKQDTPKGDSAEDIVDALVRVSECWGCNELPVVAVSIMVPGAVDCATQVADISRPKQVIRSAVLVFMVLITNCPL